MQPEQQRGRGSRASSTSSLGREVRCGCQFYQSDSLLPERRALIGRPSSRNMREPDATHCSEHEYEPIAPPSPIQAMAPVVRIADTDVMPVADSDESMDDRNRLPPRLILDGDVILPLDGRIEDSAMEAHQLGETIGDTSEEQESAQQLQERIEERFLSIPIPDDEPRTGNEVVISQVDSSTLEELPPLHHGARGLPQRIKTEAGKLRSRLRGFQRPKLSFPGRQKSEKSRSTGNSKSDKSKSEKRPSRMERIRMSLSERPRFSLPDKPKFALPDSAKFHLPERARFRLLDRPKFKIKRPNIRLPSALKRGKRSEEDARDPERSTGSTTGSRRNIFDFSTYPRIFDKKSKNRDEYATSSPKESRDQPVDSSTYPRAQKGAPLSTRWAQRFDDTADIDEEGISVAERTRPWRHPSLEEPRLSIAMEEDALAMVRRIPWEKPRKHQRFEEDVEKKPKMEKEQEQEEEEEEEEEEELRYMDYEPESNEIFQRKPYRVASREDSRTENEMSDREGEEAKKMAAEAEEFGAIKRSRSFEERMLRGREENEEPFDRSFPPVDPRRFEPRKLPYDEDEGVVEEEEEEERDISSAQSDKEQQQSSGSSCDRRRRGVIEETPSDEFFLRERSFDQDDANIRQYITADIRDALISDIANALANDDAIPLPPRRPARMRSLRVKKENSSESYELRRSSITPPAKPKRDRTARRSEEPEDAFLVERSMHRVVYQADRNPREKSASPAEPLDDIVIVKPARRKSRSSSQSQIQTESSMAPPPSEAPMNSLPPVVPIRRKRSRRKVSKDDWKEDSPVICNGHEKWEEIKLPSPEERSIAVNDAILSARTMENDAMPTPNPIPAPPKRKSRSRTASVAPDDDRTSHGAESLPEAGYVEEDIPRDETDSMRDLLGGYALVDKRDKPPRPPPPRRRRDKFSTTPRPSPPKRPQRAYSTLGPSRSKDDDDDDNNDEDNGIVLEAYDPTPYMEIDSDDGEQKDPRSGQFLSKIQGRPLPAPPRPPRAKKEQSHEQSVVSTSEFTTEITAATQTDPLPDDMVIEEEITQAKLIVAPSRSGSQVLVSTERIPTPTRTPTPPVPPLPTSQLLQMTEPRSMFRTPTDEEIEIARDYDDLKERRSQALREETSRFTESRSHPLHGALHSEETLRVSSLEVRDLKVDRLSVSQFEAHKILASEVDAIVITASELKNLRETVEDTMTPSIVKELIAIRSHLESVAAAQIKERYAMEGEVESKSCAETTVVSTKGDKEADVVISIMKDDDASTVEMKEDNVGILARNNEENSERNVAMIDESAVKSHTREDENTSNVDSTQDTQAETYEVNKLLSMQQDRIEHNVTEDPVLITNLTVPAETDVEGSSKIRPAFETMPSLVSKSQESASYDSSRNSSDLDTSFSQLPKTDKECESDNSEKKFSRKSRSRSPSPSKQGCPVRQTASPVRSLPPVISVTPDTPETATDYSLSNISQPQRAIISYSENVEQIEREIVRESSQSPTTPTTALPAGAAHFIAFPTSQIPPEFFSLATSINPPINSEPNIVDSTRQLLRAVRITGAKTINHFVNYLTSRISGEESIEKIKELELALCALLLLITAILIVYFNNTRTITYYHHWDYFNPPQ